MIKVTQKTYLKINFEINHPFLPGIREQLKFREFQISGKSCNNNLEKKL